MPQEYRQKPQRRDFSGDDQDAEGSKICQLVGDRDIVRFLGLVRYRIQRRDRRHDPRHGGGLGSSIATRSLHHEFGVGRALELLGSVDGLPCIDRLALVSVASVPRPQIHTRIDMGPCRADLSPPASRHITEDGSIRLGNRTNRRANLERIRGRIVAEPIPGTGFARMDRPIGPAIARGVLPTRPCRACIVEARISEC